MSREESHLPNAFDNATIDQLKDDVEGPSSGNSSIVEGYKPKPLSNETPTPAMRVQQALADRAEQSNTLRDKFFARATFGTGALLALNFVVFGFYMRSQWGDISEAVMLAWISATVVEVLGIIYIIARYLFGDTDVSARDGSN